MATLAAGLKFICKNEQFHDSDSDDDFCYFGETLPIINEEDETQVRKSIQPEQQVVTDNEGRRRFHGAFTGGFSAGYFNTVGSKDGFTPATFVSSRSHKSDFQTQNPEDFMDDEDTGAFGIAPRQIKARDKFESHETSKRQGAIFEQQMLGGSVPDELILLTRNTIGIQLLMKMGWRRGQGIGAKVKRKKRGNIKADHDSLKIYGCNLPGEVSEEEEDTHAVGHMFAPADVDITDFTPKIDLHGIGYKGLNPSDYLTEGGGHISLFDAPIAIDHTRKGIRGQAFGVGAFEEEDDEVYTTDDLSRYDRVLGDSMAADNSQNSKSNQKALRDVANVNAVLEGFKLAEVALANKVFPAPQLPPGFRTIHRSAPKVETPCRGSMLTSIHQQNMTAEHRGHILGESENKSVFEFVSTHDRERFGKLDRSGNNQVADQSPFTTTCLSSVSATQIDSKPVSTDNMLAGLSSFKPFSIDPCKQQRYEEFLAGNTVSSDSALTEWERKKDKKEFSQAARLFKPLTASMASRFTHGQYDDDLQKIEIDNKGDQSEQGKASAMKMYGQLTRTTQTWSPDPLLCRRCNIPNPYPGSGVLGTEKTTKKRERFSLFNFLDINKAPVQLSKPLQQAIEHSAPPYSKLDEAASTHEEECSADPKQQLIDRYIRDIRLNVGRIEKVQHAENAPLTNSSSVEDEKPPVDLFKAIFQDSESCNSSEENENDTHEDSSSNRPQPVEVNSLETVSNIGGPPPIASNAAPVMQNQQSHAMGLLKDYKEEDGNRDVGSMAMMSLTDRLSPDIEQVDSPVNAPVPTMQKNYFGPLPPPLSCVTATLSPSVKHTCMGESHRKHRHKYKDSVSKHHKEKKTKQRKQKKKSKHRHKDS